MGDIHYYNLNTFEITSNFSTMQAISAGAESSQTP
jgi:hypothetical protein